MRNFLLGVTTLLTLGGVASADRRVETSHRAPTRVEHRQPVVRDHRAPVREGRVEQHRGYERAEARRPIYVQRPVIRERYFDRRVRPRVIVENYAAMDGYTWIAGAWQWDGSEWIWQAGHYEPIAGYGYAPY